jgi:C-terminal processing protease CtpA/Prc
MMALIGAKHERFADGSTFEGLGIVPDVAVTVHNSDLRAGRDPVWERALALATEDAGQ